MQQAFPSQPHYQQLVFSHWQKDNLVALIARINTEATPAKMDCQFQAGAQHPLMQRRRLGIQAPHEV
jgi:hypothetical protein